MNPLRYLEKRIRGWLPKAPELPRPQRRSPVSDHAKVPVKPDVPIISNRKLQFNSGILIGLGAGLVLAGFLGWLSVNSTYGTPETFFSAGGLDPNYYLFNRLIDQIAIYLSLISIGAYALLLGALILKSRAAKKLFYSKGPHYRLGSGLLGGGRRISAIFYAKPFRLHSHFGLLGTATLFRLLSGRSFPVGVRNLCLEQRNTKPQPRLALKSEGAA